MSESWPDRRQTATQGLSGLTLVDWLVLGAWDAATAAGLTIAQVDATDSEVEIALQQGLGGRLRFALTAPGDSDYVVRFTDGPFAVRASHGTLKVDVRLNHDAAGLIGALAFATFRVDTLLFLPANERDSRFAAESDVIGIPSAYLRALATTSPPIARALGLI